MYISRLGLIYLQIIFQLNAFTTFEVGCTERRYIFEESVGPNLSLINGTTSEVFSSYYLNYYQVFEDPLIDNLYQIQ